MSIFEPGERTDPTPASHGESHARFLARVSGSYWDQVRELLEQWYSHLCADAKTDVRARLRSSEDRQFEGAFLELYLHEAFTRLGYDVTCHPEVPSTSRKPDFYVQGAREPFYVEARSISSSNEQVAAKNRRAAIYDALDKLESPNFFLWIDVKKESTTPLRTKALRRRLTGWLEGLDPDEQRGPSGQLSIDSFPRFDFDDAGWRITFRAIAKSPSARGTGTGLRPLGIFGGSAWVDDSTPMRDALSDKGKAYGDLGAGFVVALGMSSLSIDDRDVMNALYGRDQVQIRRSSTGEESVRSVRAPDGYWFGGTEWRHKNVSAVLVAKNIYPTSVARQVHTYWEHPEPDHIVTGPSLWRRAVPAASGLEFVEASTSQSELFGLPPDWPLGEPFPR